MTTLRLLPDFEAALRGLSGIQAVSVVTSADGVPTEVHVLASPGKAAKQVVRDVQSLAMAGFDLVVDHRIVSVVQIGDDRPDAVDVATAPAAVGGPAARGEGSAAGPDHARRATLTSVGLRTSGAEATATVTISIGDEEFLGSATGSANVASRPRLAATATLDAVRALLGQPCDLEHAQVLPAGSHEMAVVVLHLVLPRVGEQVLTGSAVVRSHAEDAVCRAVLDALNRQLSG
ncbi:hypothetical protein [Angustibacter aerolatus]|uniref:Uncharacterized protein n=1 Tax=Angustibacter aerolatus TaxID=1162965 RepID=A0ABQ6JL96_9ACTN|nr:hypothetical protein [Angustibacter aerolatus]GMA88552.1 hypothetical protein GCM10025868_38020 [Angustibacter aerolatus]